MKKTIKYLSYFIFGLVLAIFLLPFIFEDELKDAFRQALNENLNAEVSFHDINLNFWRDFPNAHLKVDSLKITGVDTFQNVELFNAHEIHLEIGLASMLKKNTPYSVKSLNIYNANLNLIKLNDSITNYLITKPSEDTTVYEIELDNYQIYDSQLRFFDAETTLNLDVANINHHGSGKLNQDIYDLDTYSESDKFNLSFAGIPYLSNAEFKADAIISVDLPNEKYTFKKNNIVLNAFPFYIDGYTQLFEDYIELNFDLKADNADFAQLYSLAPMAYTSDYKSATINGTGNISSFIKGRFSGENEIYPDFFLNVEVDNGEIKYDRLPHPIKNIKSNIEIKYESQNRGNVIINVPAFQFNIQDDYVKGHYNSSGPIENPTLDFSLDALVDLSKWKNSIPLAAPSILNGTGKIAISLQSDLKSIQENRFDKIKFSSNSYINNLEIALENMNPIKADLIKFVGDPRNIFAKAENLYYSDSDFSFELSLIHPLQIIIDKAKAQGNLVINSRRINLNSIYGNSNVQAGSENKMPLELFGQFDIESNINEIIYQDKSFRFNQFKARTNQDDIVINAINSQISESDLSIDGSIKNINNYLNNKGPLSGNINLKAQKFIIDPWLTNDQTKSDSSITLPSNTEIDIKVNIEEVVYKGLKMSNVDAKGSLFNQAFQISEARTNSLGGKFLFQGIYATPQDENPIFDFKLDLESILFQNAFKELNTFRAIAPIAKYISGQFNTTLIMSGSLNEQLMPVWKELDASGFIETLNSKIQGFEPASKLADKLGISRLKDWNIGNTKNWFEIVDGMVQLKENTYNLGDGIILTIAGKHGIGSNMDYDIYMEIPRVLLKKNEITGTLDKGLIFLENAASKVGVNLDQGENILIKIDLTGKLPSPDIQIKPVGTTGKTIDETLESQFETGKEKIEERISDLKKNVKDSIQTKKSEVIDSLKESINQKSSAAIETVKTKVNSKLDSLVNKALSDSTSSPLKDVLKEKAKKEEEKLKSVLDKWAPKKKKVKKDTANLKY